MLQIFFLEPKPGAGAGTEAGASLQTWSQSQVKVGLAPQHWIWLQLGLVLSNFLNRGTFSEHTSGYTLLKLVKRLD